MNLDFGKELCLSYSFTESTSVLAQKGQAQISGVYVQPWFRSFLRRKIEPDPDAVNGYVLSFLREWYSTPSKRFETRTTIERIEVTTINDVCGFLDSFAPTRLAEDWDNVGLLAGDPAGEAVRIMTCLTVTPESAVEAINAKTDLIVSHHPLPFRPLKRLTTSTTPSRLLWELIRAGVSIYSPHTGFDSALEGINQTLGQRIGLQEIAPLVPIVDDPDGLGAGRIGTLANSLSLDEFVSGVKKSFSLDGIQVVGELNRSVEKIAVACGSGGSFLEQARRSHCDTFVTGEANFHTCLEARANNISLVLLGHFASERFAVEALADRLAQKFDGVEVWASSEESDPLIWV